MAKPTKKGRGKGKVRKTSNVKLINKKQSKLGNQVKRAKVEDKDKRRKKRQLKLQQDESTNNGKPEQKRNGDSAGQGNVQEEGEEEELPLEDSDVEYFSTPGYNTSFVNAVKRHVKGDDLSTKKRKRKNEEEVEEEFEKMPRQLFPEQRANAMKMALPIKTKAGLVQRMIERTEGEDSENMSSDEEEDKEGSHDQSANVLDNVPEKEDLEPLTGVELYAQRQVKLESRKRKIAAHAQTIIANPEDNMSRLKDLTAMLKEWDIDVYVTVRKLVMVSLMEVFCDVVPGYHIRLRTDVEKSQRMKKDTEKVLAHEEDLLKCYKAFLEFLETTAKAKQDKGTKKRKPIIISESARLGLAAVAVQCLCRMLSHHPHFNLRNNIITVLVPYMNHKENQISDVACHTVRQIFREDKAGEVTLETVRCISRMIKGKDFKVKTKVLETFLALKIKEVSYTDPVDVKNDKKKKPSEQMSRRERKRNKHIVMLEIDLQETKATEDKKKRLKLHTDTIQAVFLTFFRILKRATKSPLLPTVLEGLAKYAHLINLDFFNDLFKVFGTLIESGDLSYRESLHCVQTAFTILSGQGASLNIDPILFYKHLYQRLFHIHAGHTSADVPIILDCLDIMVNKRKKQVSQQRILAFLKRLATLTLMQQADGTVSLLAAMRNVIQMYSYTDLLFDNEATGSGVFLPEVDDPEHCNAHNSMLWELAYLHRHFHPAVVKYAAHICRGAPSGEGQGHLELRKTPLALFKSFETEAEKAFGSHVPKTAKKTKYKVTWGKLYQTDMQAELLSTLEAVPDIPNTPISLQRRKRVKKETMHVNGVVG